MPRVLAAGALALAALVPGPLPAEGRGAPARQGDASFPTFGPARSRWLRAPGPVMVRLAATRFVMGSTPAEVVGATALCGRGSVRCEPSDFADELPAHPVRVASFRIDRTEVTVAAYRRCVDARRCREPPYAEGAARFDRPELPVVLVTRDDAAAYCAFRGARLPTEAEWERAARGPRSRRFPWGRSFHGALANHGRAGLDRTERRDGYAELAPVGSFPGGRTVEGVLDLAGNASEWVADWYRPTYPSSAVRDPRGPAAPGPNGTGVVRGGDFESPAAWLRGAARREADVTARVANVGFRCARSAGSAR